MHSPNDYNIPPPSHSDEPSTSDHSSSMHSIPSPSYSDEPSTSDQSYSTQTYDDEITEVAKAKTESLPPVELSPKLLNRFHEPVLLLVSLNEAFKKNLNSNFGDPPVYLAQSSESAFHCFVNKLGQLCDRERGGDTVTAFVVLKHPDHIEYRFASNRLNEDQLRCTGEFITSLLRYLSTADISAKQVNISTILRKALVFNRPRVAAYLNLLRENISLCIAACVREGSDDSTFISNELQKLKKLLVFCEDKKLADGEFSELCENLIYTIDKLYRSEVDELIRDRTNEGRINESEFWCELRHSTGRLLSYLHAVKALIFARKQWPELYEDFEVSGVTSSALRECPFRNSNKRLLMSMEKIIGRMVSKPEDMKNYQLRADYLKRFEIDRIIQENVYFEPYVHAEVLLLDSLLKDGHIRPSRFFNNYRYIGCSKPTCRLCEYYFLFHPSGVAVRPTHKNVYMNWRMPDFRHGKNEAAKTARTLLMNQILERVRDDVRRTLVEKTPEGKPHDSNTEPTWQNSDSVSLVSLVIRSSRSVVDHHL